MASFQLHINGNTVSVEVEGDTPLLWVIRDHLGLTGTKFGCGKGHCGACSIHLDGKTLKSCSLPVSQLPTNAKITTIEGLADTENGEPLTPIQQAWCDLDVPQCGYCQAGQIMCATALLNENPKPTEDEINTAMAGNICRCATYTRIREAILTASNQS